MTLVNPTLQGYITQLQNSVFNSKQYDFTAMTNSIDSQLTVLKSVIDSYGLGDLPDFDVTSTNGASQINTFNQIASKSLFNTDCPSSSFNIFYQDVWVPGLSTSYQKYVACLDKVGIDNTTCGLHLDDTSICYYSRCMDTFSIISAYYRNSSGFFSNIIAHANARYGTCTPFNNYINNFHNNYVKKVVDKIGNSVDDASDTTKLAGRFVTNAKTPITSLKTSMNGNVKTLFT